MLIGDMNFLKTESKSGWHWHFGGWHIYQSLFVVCFVLFIIECCTEGKLTQRAKNLSLGDKFSSLGDIHVAQL